jgi:hypothetical protein
MNWKPSKPIDPRTLTLMEERRRLGLRIKLARMPVGTDPYRCKRCGYEWVPRKNKLPKCCAQCHSAAWQEEPRAGVKYAQRSPSDPPNPNWKTRWFHAQKREAGRFASSPPKTTDAAPAPRPALDVLPPPPGYAGPLSKKLREVTANEDAPVEADAKA